MPRKLVDKSPVVPEDQKQHIVENAKPKAPPVEKVKRKATEKQLEALAKGRMKMMENMKKRNKQKKKK
tara:strand:+ start:665 stop:868 length:204 start_codon:yes stop_codon:yes gene_type:complete